MSELLDQMGLVPFFTRQLESTDLLDERLGRVTEVQRSRTTLVTATGERFAELCAAMQHGDALNRPTVGDWVLLDESLARIETLLERKSLFKRMGAGTGNQIQLIAANVDVLFIVTSCNDDFNLSRLERYLALCAESDATPVIVLTKADLTDDLDDYIGRARSAGAGVAVEAVNALDASSLEAVRAWIGKRSTVALVGSSGVGKSTILNSLAGETLMQTGAIRDDDKKGRHTTTHRQLHLLPCGGLVVDMPGIRELKMADVNQSIGEVFDDIEALAGRCKFADCAHETEPGCAVQKAIAEGRLDARRLANYRKVLRENAQATATLAQKRAQGRGFSKVVKEAKAWKQNMGEE